MYEKDGLNMAKVSATECATNCNTGFNFPEFQTQKRILAEEALKVSDFILDCLMGKRPQETKEGFVVDSLMTDLESEYDTIKELYDNLIRIATCLGRN